MPMIHFDQSAWGPALAIDVAGGTRLVDVCDEASAPVAFSCRAASCATCRVEVASGGELLEPPGPHERELLVSIGARPSDRLACQVVVRAASGVVRVRWAGGVASRAV